MSAKRLYCRNSEGLNLGSGLLALVWGTSGFAIVSVEDILTFVVKMSAVMMLVRWVASNRPNLDRLDRLEAAQSATPPRSRLIYNTEAIRMGSMIL